MVAPAAPEVAEHAVSRLAEVLDVHRTNGPRPSRTSPGLVLYYLSGRLPPTVPTGAAGGAGGAGGASTPARDGRPASTSRGRGATATVDVRAAVELAELLIGELERLQHEAGGLRAALELLTCCDHGNGLGCPDCEPLPPLVRRALEGTAGRAVAAELAASEAAKAGEA